MSVNTMYIGIWEKYNKKIKNRKDKTMTNIEFQDNWKNLATFAIRGNTKIPATKKGFKDDNLL